HSKCDNKGETITIACHNNGSIFGGYTSVSWNAKLNSFSDCTDSWLFSLKNPHGDKPLKLENTGALYVRRCAIYNSQYAGAVFGAGYDLAIFDNDQFCSSSPNVSFQFPGKDQSFSHTHEARTYFTGYHVFAIRDIEVWGAVDYNYPQKN